MGLFSKKKTMTVSIPSAETEQSKPRLTEAVTVPQRKYFEVFGDALQELKFLKTLAICLIALSVYLTLTLKTSIKKPPLVIRVDQLGLATAIKDIQSQLQVSPAEISNFTQYFLQYFTAWNYYTYDDDFTRAFQMMTSNCQQKLNDYFTSNQTINQIKNEQLKVKLNVTEITIEKDSPEFINLKVKGYRTVRSYQSPDVQREVVFENFLTLKKVSRTDKTPWGLLVDSWSESLFKAK